MKTRFAKVLVLLTLVVAMVAMTAIPALAVDPVTVLDGQVTVSSNDASSLSLSDDGATVTGITAKSGLLSSKKGTFVITNSSGSAATISFDYSTDANTYSGVDSSKGNISVTLTSGETYTITITAAAAWGGKTATLTLSNFAIEMITETFDVTVSYGSTGTVTADGKTVTSGEVLSVPSEGMTLVASPVSGAKFMGWINTVDNTVVSTEATYQFSTLQDMSIRAVFAKADAAPVFYADGTSKVFESFDAAISYASSGSNKTITLASDATLPAGNYEIPAGVTLLLPYDAANTLKTTTPGQNDGSYVTPTVYRTLNMASGANITVKGALSLSGQQSAIYGYNGMPYGPLPFIKMASNSNITVENGGFLYAWGYITGSGSVTVKNGGTVYENFQIADYRGGDATTAMVSNADTYAVFPFSQYYIQNIEVPMTLYAGAKENAYTSITVTLAGTQGSDVPFIGSDNSMFVINSGYVVKDYVEGKGRLAVTISGDVSVSTITLSMKLSLIGTKTIDSSKYLLPINNNLTIDVQSGTINMDQSIAFLPGSELYIREGAKCILGEGKKIHVYDLDQWLYNNGANGYAGTSNLPYVNLKYVPGGNGTEGRLKDALVQVDGTIDASAGEVYVTVGGANIYSTGKGMVTLNPGTDTVAYQVTTNSSDISGWPEISIQNVLLKNADGSDVNTAAEAGTYTYYASTGRWDRPSHYYVSTVTAPTCTEGGYTTHTCEVCGGSFTDTEVAATGHTAVTDPAVAPTCTENGLTEGSHCSVCNEVIVAQAVVEALDHDGVVDAAVEATCTTAGKTEGMHCDRCGEVLIAQEVIPALGHAEVTDEAKNATCNETGLTEGKHCETCGEVLIAQEVIPALGHDEVIDKAVDATCTATGLTEGKHCDRCGEVIIAQEEISALGHTEVIDEAVDATCTATGLTEGKHCSVCNEVLTAQEVVPAKGHSYGTWVVTAPTYKEAGSQSKTCSVCGDVVTEEIPVLANPVTGWNITLKDNIGVNFVMALKDVDVVTVTVNGNAVECKIADGKFSVNVAAAQMMDEIAISVNGLPLAKTYSVRGYADEILNGDYDEAAKTLVKNMLVYGGAAQTYFGYNASNLASAGIEVTAAAPEGGDEIAVSDSLSGISFYGAALVHETKTAVRIYFTGNIDGLDFGDYVPVEKNGMYYVEVSGINPQDLGNAVVVVVTDGTDSLSVSYSPLNYMVRMYNKAGSSDNAKALVQALYGYYKAAEAYTA